MRPFPSRLFRLLPTGLRTLTLAIACGLPAVASANAVPPYREGHTAAEPQGVADVAIDSEQLSIDLRPLKDGRPVEVEAVYRLLNQSTETVTLDLVFVAGSPDLNDFTVRLNGTRIETAPAEVDDLPDSWKPPETTPLPDREQGLFYPAGRGAARKLTVDIPAGRHALQVTYRSTATAHNFGSPQIYWQFAYVLEPARNWGGFGQLQLTVHVPQDWLLVSSLPLEQDADTYTAIFDELPETPLALTAQSPLSPIYPFLVYGTLAGLGLAGLGGAVMCWRRGRRSPTSDPDMRRAIVAGLCWAVAVFAAGMLATWIPSELGIPPSQRMEAGYGKALATIGTALVSVLVAPIGFLLAMAGSNAGRRRQARQSKSARK